MSRIVIDPDICNGQPVIRGTCIAARTVLELLAAGDSIEDVMAEYPSLTREDVLACLETGDAPLRLELACALYAQGKVTKVSGAELAGVDFFSFQGALGEREIYSYTVEDLHKELEAMDRIFGKADKEPHQG